MRPLMTALVSHNKCFITLVIHTRSVSVLYPSGFHFISMISHALCPLHNPTFIITEILFLINEVNSQAWKFGMRLSGGKFCSEAFGVCWKRYGVIWFWFLSLFDNRRHLKSGVSPPAWLWIFTYDYGKP